MATVTVRITERAHRTLQDLARSSDRTLQATLDDAVEVYRRRRVLEEANAAFATLRSDRHAWASERQERQAWDATLADGIEEAR